MPAFLVFRLWGPLASWGGIAVGEVRGTHDAPGRSAIMGLLGAALGIRGDEADALSDLATSVHMGVRIDDPGGPMCDFHTIQTSGDRRPVVSRQALLRRDPALWTVVSRRDYRCGGRWTVVLQSAHGAPVDLETIAAALRKPRFTLYLGRKACPLGLPLAPALLTVPTAMDALAQYAPLPDWTGIPSPDGECEFVADPDLTLEPIPHQRMQRRDERLDWESRRFVDRVVYRLQVPATPTGDER